MIATDYHNIYKLLILFTHVLICLFLSELSAALPRNGIWYVSCACGGRKDALPWRTFCGIITHLLMTNQSTLSS